MQPGGNGGDHNDQEEKREHDLHQHQLHQYGRYRRNIAVTDGGRGNETEVNRLQVAEVMAARKHHLVGYGVRIVDIGIDKTEAKDHFQDIDQGHQQGAFETDGLLVDVVQEDLAEHEMNRIDGQHQGDHQGGGGRGQVCFKQKIIPADLEQAVSFDHHFADQQLLSSAQLPDKGTRHDEGGEYERQPQHAFEPEVVVGFVIPDLFEGDRFLNVYAAGFALRAVGTHDELGEKIHYRFIFFVTCIFSR